ncbi:MAG: hypothetical protein AMJ61_09145 [Desulfobacterales bacterium SG8_35_2]|nr:MAG: hypothetical protein AMJ61_09145 [Desulfobacterales bacterium SG8_35_2]
MKKKSNYMEVGVHNNKDFVKIDRIEWLKELYSNWLKKRNFILNYNEETYLINEPDELDTEGYW